MTYTLTGRYPLGSLEGRPGRLRFTPSTTIVGDDNIILPAPVEVDLDSDGAFQVTLVGTDDTDYAPSGWVWTVTELMTGGRAPWSFYLTADSDLSELTTVPTPADPNLYVPVTRTLVAGAGLTGGGTLAANRTFAVGAGTGIAVGADDVAVDTSVIATRTYADGVGTASDATAAGALAAHEGDSTGVHGITDSANLVYTDDARLSDDRDPTAHAASHGSAGADPVTVAESQVTGLTAALAAKIPAATLDANSVLYAVTDNTPAALAVGASTLVGRAASGNVAALSVADVRTLVGTTRVTRPLTDDRLVQVWNGATWSVVSYDSGWRDISSGVLTIHADITNSTPTFNAYLRRIDNTVEFYVAGRTKESGLSGASATLITGVPAAFAPGAKVVVTGVALNGSNRGASPIHPTMYYLASGVGRVLGFVTGANVYFNLSYTCSTDAAIPTSLPGILVSAAPA